MKLLSNTIKVLPKTILNLRGYKLTEQVSIIKSLLERYKEDPAIAFSVLEKHTIEPNQEIDDSTALLYELSVRKEIVDERHNSMVTALLYELSVRKEIVDERHNSMVESILSKVESKIEDSDHWPI